jgi:His/Glu/Gln/Arg/opine family amino acid ABC transporter permease subunit
MEPTPFFFTEKALELSSRDILFILGAVKTTLLATSSSLLLGTVLGFALGLIATFRIPVVNRLPYIFIEPLRNSPLVVQLFLLYYGVSMLTKINFTAWQAAIITLSCNTAAFIAVVVRSSIEAIPKHQWESAYALGHSYVSAFVHIIFGQAFRIFIPPALNIYISQLHTSSLLSFIGFMEITHAGQVLTIRTLRPFMIWTVVLLLYFSISYPLSLLARLLEKRFAFVTDVLSAQNEE